MGSQGICGEDTALKYVGSRPMFEMVHVRKDYSGLICMSSLCCLLLSTLFLAWLMCPEQHQATTSPAPLPFDCHPVYGNLEGGWSFAKRAFCCEEFGRGCTTSSETREAHVTSSLPPLPTPPPTTALPYDCGATGKGQKAWSWEQQAWCCRYAGRGCPTAAPTPAPPAYDCSAGFDNWLAGWSPGKKVWCCRHVRRGCSTPAPTPPATPAPTPPPPPFDCAADYGDWIDRWSTVKKIWCCHHVGRGCREPTAPPTQAPRPSYDCSAGFQNWVVEWSVEHKVWCCQREGRGCAAPVTGCATTPPRYDCAAGFANWVVAWSAEQKTWCCQHTGKGCQNTYPPPVASSYDCTADFQNWPTAWANAKKVWCCAHVGKGCPM